MRGSIRARSDGYEISVSAGVDPVTGKRKRMYRWARTKREAERTLTDLLKAVDSGSSLTGQAHARRLPPRALAPHVSTRVRSRTALRYSQLLELHVIPSIGPVKMAKLKPGHVPAGGRRHDRRRTGAAHRRGGLPHAPRCPGSGVRWQLLSVNAGAAVRPPKAERPELDSPDAAKVAKVLDAARGTRLYVPLALAASTGVRRGEAPGTEMVGGRPRLGSLRVTASLQRAGADLVFSRPKTDRGRRTVGLPPATVVLLRRHRKTSSSAESSSARPGRTSTS
jgi:integrase